MTEVISRNQDQKQETPDISSGKVQFWHAAIGPAALTLGLFATVAWAAFLVWCAVRLLA